MHSKNWYKVLMTQKNRRQISGGLLGGRLSVWLHLLVEKPENPLCLSKDKKDATVKSFNKIIYPSAADLRWTQKTSQKSLPNALEDLNMVLALWTLVLHNQQVRP